MAYDSFNDVVNYRHYLLKRSNFSSRNNQIKTLDVLHSLSLATICCGLDKVFLNV